MKKIMATVNFGKNQVTQSWDFIPRDDEKDEDAILVIASFENGDLVGIPLDNSRIKPLHDIPAAQFSYSGQVKITDAEEINRAGFSN